jgi:ribosomal protein L37AE/L43A
MIAQRCPKCGSSRVKRGYTDTLLILRIIGVYALLCDNCNLLFKGFAVPGTVPPRGSRAAKRRAGRDQRRAE